ncbi:phosphoglycolate phosphatase [Tahibacter aquaticus]|uniref:Phosphoglycolate phosphatase n=1 Tax=Tahibacter aquaticus TaxID=520092 RepID=A0A4R6YRN7_9GAMM|nr:phosphoglycolate phosphatase [Tahibacter aquaticus]TDR40791.1 phosphoglycolate phosphatase [Tahibacter aquaticus]
MRLLARELDAVLFDLDGTLVDSAPDLVAAMQRLCRELGQADPDADGVRAVVSKGGRAMLRRGLPGLDDARYDALLPRFLDLYAADIAQLSRPFDGVEALIAAIESRGARWGVVTNKPGWLARPLLQQLGWSQRSAALVSGDCLPLKKPDPAPILHACELAGIAPGRCIYVGDDLRDIQAGRAAGMFTVAAAWGYLDGEDPQDWAADWVAESAEDLRSALELSPA